MYLHASALTIAKSEGCQADFFLCLTWEMWRPRLRWMVAHSSQTNTHRFTDAQQGSAEEHSAHISPPPEIRDEGGRQGTVGTRFNDLEGTGEFWSLNPSVVKSNS